MAKESEKRGLDRMDEVLGQEGQAAVFTRPYGGQPQKIVCSPRQAEEYLKKGYCRTEGEAWELQPEPPDVEVLEMLLKDCEQELEARQARLYEQKAIVHRARDEYLRAVQALPQEREIQERNAFNRDTALIRGRCEQFLASKGDEPFRIWEMLELAETSRHREFIGQKYRDPRFVIEEYSSGDALLVANKERYLAKKAAAEIAEKTKREAEIRERLNRRLEAQSLSGSN